MRPLLYNDVLAAVAAVSAAPASVQVERAAEILREADLADAYRRRYGAAHPVFGDGSLLAAALRRGQSGSTSFQTPDSLCAWITVLQALLARLPQPDAQLMQRRTLGSNSNLLKAMSSPHSSQ
nr:hypothetical protein [Marivita sp. XM-24bin2]